MKSSNAIRRRIWAARLLPALVLAAIWGVWEIAARSESLNLRYFPPPSMFISYMVRNGFRVSVGLDSFHLGWAAASSAGRVLAGLFISFVVAVPLGAVLAFVRPMAFAVLPVVRLIGPVAPIAWIPLAIALFGDNPISAVFIVFMATFPGLTLASAASFGSPPRAQVELARTLGARGVRLWWHVSVPSALPGIFLMARLNFLVAWTSLLAAESIGIRDGLGAVLLAGREGLNPEVVLAGATTIGLTGGAIDAVLLALQRKVSWSRGAHA